MAYTIIDNRALRAEAAIEPELPVTSEVTKPKSSPSMARAAAARVLPCPT